MGVGFWVLAGVWDFGVTLGFGFWVLIGVLCCDIGDFGCFYADLGF